MDKHPQRYHPVARAHLNPRPQYTTIHPLQRNSLCIFRKPRWAPCHAGFLPLACGPGVVATAQPIPLSVLDQFDMRHRCDQVDHAGDVVMAQVFQPGNRRDVGGRAPLDLAPPRVTARWPDPARRIRVGIETAARGAGRLATKIPVLALSFAAVFATHNGPGSRGFTAAVAHHHDNPHSDQENLLGRHQISAA